MNDDAARPELPSQSFVPVCAIGASAGGITALQGLFRQLPDDLGLAYVIILHLSPDQPSALSEILSVCTRMPVVQIDDGPTLKGNCVFVIPPDRELVIDGDNVTARPFTEPRGRRAPIDMFFRSVAAARGDGIAMVLSGAGSDGTLGLRAVKEAGGVIMVQEPAEAGFGSMPQNAIATGDADFVAPLARLAERLAEVARSKEAVRSLDIDGSANDLRRIVAFLRARTGHDFSSYKRATVMRRVLRRMQVCRTDTLAAYADYLLTTPEETKELFSDLLISVTMFFRDPGAFVALERLVVGPLFDDMDPSAETAIRAWVVGCATGEEAYSLGMLLLDEATRRRLHPTIQIFATDLDEGALATAREGRYPRTIEADVSEERLARFFTNEGTHYRVRKELRDSVLFAKHSAIKEPPFMRLDLVTCRNLMIYLERSLQQQLCTLFHYGLKPGRFLFLGSAETADSATDLFAPLDREARIYSSRPHALQTLPILPQFAAPERLAGPGQAILPRSERPDLSAALHVAALEGSAPPSALVDDGHAILHLSPTAGLFIQPSAGPLSNLLPAVVHPELRLDLRLALTRALEGKEPTLTLPISITMAGGMRRVALHVIPVFNAAHMGAQALVLFLDGGAALDSAAPDAAPDTRPDEVRRLHAELKALQEALVASRTGHEAAIQDLRATNEELQSINEEYRSTAEELETSKEELQSINEELHTVNAELKSKLSSISVAHSDLQNLTTATEIGTLFLDADLRIRMFTPPIADLFNVAVADIGRTITDFTHRLEYDGLEEDARRVLRDLALVEMEVRSKGGRWYEVRLRPYRTVEDRIDGTVVTFVDITARREAEAALRASEELRRIALEGGRMGTWRWNLGDCLVWGDAAFLELWGFPPSDEPLHLSLFTDRMTSEGAAEVEGIVTRAIKVGEEFDGPLEIVSGPTAGRWIRWRGRVGSGSPSLLYGVSFDITDQRRAEAALKEAEVRQSFLLDLSDALRPIGDPTEIQRVATMMLGEHLKASRVFYVAVEADGDTATILGHYTDAVPSRVGQYSLSAFSSYAVGEWRAGRIASTSDVNIDPRYSQAEREAYASLSTRAGFGVPLIKEGRLVALLGIDQSRPRHWTSYDTDLASEIAERTWATTERARAEAALRESEERLRQFGEASQDVLWTRDANTFQWVYLTPAFEVIYGLDREAALTGDNMANWLDLIVPEDREHAQASLRRVCDGEWVTFEYRIRRPADGEIRWLRNTDFPIRDASEKVVRIGGIGQDVTELKEAEEALTAAELRQRALVEGIPQLVWRAVDGGEWTWASPQWSRYTGQDEAASQGRGWLDVLHPDDREAALNAWARALETSGFEVEYRIWNAGSESYRWFQTRATPVRDADCALIEWLGTSNDIDDLRGYQERQAILVAELQHRTRNLLGVVRSTAEMTLRTSSEMDEFAAKFRDRLDALARVQSLLSRLNEGDRVTFDELIGVELSALGHADGPYRVTLDGPKGVALRSSTVQTFAMGLHELATNAVKYGALKQQPGGQLTVTWRLERPDVDGQPWLYVDWIESGVVMPSAGTIPQGGGQGRQLIERALPYQLGAKTTYVMGPDGVRCSIALPVSNRTAAEDDRS